MNPGLEITNSKVRWVGRVSPPYWLTVVNVIKKTCWKNNERTFIFIQPDIKELTNDRVFELLAFMGNCHADDFSSRRVYKVDVIRLTAKWWIE